MKKIHVVIVLAIYICNLLLATGLDERYCFQFTWLGPTDDKNINCNKSIKTPCVKPFLFNSTSPNTDQIWEDEKENVKDLNYFCELTLDTVCLKYTYIYNNAIVNTSSFCGKIIEDQTAVTSGCYDQYIDGYTIEVCACQSRNGKPCNATIRNTYSILITIGATAVTLFVYKIFNIS